MLIRNSYAQVLVSSVQGISACLSPQVAEASAILRGMHVAVEADLLPAVLKSDAKWVVEAINDNRPSYADIGIIIKDIVDVMSEYAISVSFISRKANMVAHALAKLAFVDDSSFIWKEEFPPCLNSVILEEIVDVMSEYAISVSFISRKANMVAHALAKLALVDDSSFIWKEEFPPCLNSWRLNRPLLEVKIDIHWGQNGPTSEVEVVRLPLKVCSTSIGGRLRRRGKN
ncbi:hypothetical protein Dsin_001496 [Dipteronia sinensis]|uniref:RNase H type-1 domain-containing protein n=1 Tax=Dipteronia sinensis TaxID=43782 RepID=A0AAE0EKC6_9ROSI|nr:hypothetical protein Dsin_001496 [Dipteronia sinensis]